MNNNIKTLILGALVSGLCMGGKALAQEPTAGAPKEPVAEKPADTKEKKDAKGGHHKNKGKKNKDGCNGKDGCSEGKKEKKSE